MEIDFGYPPVPIGYPIYCSIQWKNSHRIVLYTEDEKTKILLDLNETIVITEILELNSENTVVITIWDMNIEIIQANFYLNIWEGEMDL